MRNDSGDIEFFYFAETALDAMSSIVTELGVHAANQKPALPQANSPFAILTHCVGVVRFWIGHIIHGREVERDRNSEFTAQGPLQPLLLEVAELKDQLRKDLENIAPAARVRLPAHQFEIPDHHLTQSFVLRHVQRELAQHHGQMEITRDVLQQATHKSRN